MTTIKMFVLLAALSFLASCSSGDSEPSATEKAIEGLQNKYEDLTDGDLDAPVQWASEDIKKIGDWQYKILDIGNVSGAEMETVLNEAGSERWEVIWIEKNLQGYAVFMKRPSISYLSKIPLSQLGRFVVGDSAPKE
jgi:hypothetical protein